MVPLAKLHGIGGYDRSIGATSARDKAAGYSTSKRKDGTAG